jgi:hypothetical protein
MSAPEFNVDDGIDPAEEVDRLRLHAAEHEREIAYLHGQRNDLLVHADVIRGLIEADEKASIADSALASALAAFWGKP